MVKKLVIVLLAIVALSSCKLLIRVVLGIDPNPPWKSKKAIVRDFKKAGIPKDESYILDTASLNRSILALFLENRKILKRDTNCIDSIALANLVKLTQDDVQPVQVRYFNRSGEPLFKMVNCDVDPPIPLKWNREGNFDVFPPKTPKDKLEHKNNSLMFFLPHIKKLNGDTVTLSSLDSSDFYVIVFWNTFFKRPSRKLIKRIAWYRKKHPDQKTQFLYVNNHNSQLWMSLNAKQKEEVYKFKED